LVLDLIIFDLDGTLIDSRVDLTNSVNVALRHVGLPIKSVDETIRMIGSGTRALVERAVGPHPEKFHEAFTIFSRDYGLHLLDHTRLYPGTPEMLDLFHGETVLAVMSNKRQRFCDAILQGLGADRYFKIIQGGDGPLARKPNPAPLLHICESLAISPSRAVMVGDSPVDVEAGKRAGMRTVGITGGFTPPEVMDSSGADLLLSTVAALRQGFLG
jgi:phosphoglycolate phosphatase